MPWYHDGMDNEVVSILAKAYESGLSADAVACRYGVSAWKVFDSCRRLGVPRRPAKVVPREFTEDEQDLILSMWENGCSSGAIALEMGTYILKIQLFLQDNGVTYERRPSRRRGPQSHMWRGGRTKTKKGYVLVLLDDDHPLRCMALASGYVQEHRLVMAQQLGRPLFADETVHHKNGVKDDNDPGNLELWVSHQPEGQRPEDLVVWAREILRRYG